jgi:GNAT superfamily N-acetyltransferase
LATIHKLPKLRIAALEHGQLDQAADFLHQQWQLVYRQHLPQPLLAERTLSYFRHYLAVRKHSCWLAWMGDRLIGLAISSANCIEDLWVSQRFQRQGIASRLLDTVLQDLRRRGYRYAQVGCESFNQIAIDFFTAAGWQKIGAESLEVAAGLRFDALVYSIELNAMPSIRTGPS